MIMTDSRAWGQLLGPLEISIGATIEVNSAINVWIAGKVG